MTRGRMNLFDPLPAAGKDEIFDILAQGTGTTVERIVSHGQMTPEDSWLEEDRTEWVVLLRGRAHSLSR